MNVLMVDQYGQPGGAQKCLLDLIAGWPREDALMVAAPADGTLLRSVQAAGFITEAIPCGPYTGRGVSDALRLYADARAQCRIVRSLIRRFGIDVVYVNGPRVLPAAALAARGHCPLVYHAWNLLQRRTDRALIRLALGSCRSAVIACCAYSAGKLPATVILNGVPDAGFRQRRYPPKVPWRLGVVGRISPEKGHLVLMDAIRLLVAEGHRIALTVAGAPLFSSTEYEAQVRRRAEGLDVRFAGWIDDIEPFLAEVDLSVVPSIAEPGPTRVIPEAFSAGVPVVALPTGGIPEVIRDERNGFLAAGVGARDLATALRRALLAPPAELTAITRRARGEWESYWNVDRWRREVVAAIRAAAIPKPARDSFDVSVAASGNRPAPSA